MMSVVPSAASAICPMCGTPSGRRHTWCRRLALDLPWRKFTVRLRVWTRCFFCDEPACPRKIFAERFTGLLPRSTPATPIRRPGPGPSHAQAGQHATCNSYQSAKQRQAAHQARFARSTVVLAVSPGAPRRIPRPWPAARPTRRTRAVPVAHPVTRRGKRRFGRTARHVPHNVHKNYRLRSECVTFDDVPTQSATGQTEEPSETIERWHAGGHPSANPERAIASGP
jgi:hypothetical protein